MKTIVLTLIASISLCFSGYAQSCIPSYLSLSAVARDAQGFPITVPIDVQVELYDGDPAAGANQLYCELVLNLFPNSYGEFAITFGSPQFWCNPNGLDDVDWTTCDIWYKLSWRITGNTGNPVEIASNNFSSVPYAFGARTAERLKNFNTDNAQNGNVMVYDAGTGQWNPGTISGGSTTISAGAGISVSTSGGNTTITNTGDASSTNELQSLAISGNTLSISNGNSVALDGSSTNELQSLSISGNTLSISNGNSVTLPSSSNQYASMYSTTLYNTSTRNTWVSDPDLRVTVPATGTYMVTMHGFAGSAADGAAGICGLRNVTQANTFLMQAWIFGHNPSGNSGGYRGGTGSSSRIMSLTGGDILELTFMLKETTVTGTSALFYGGQNYSSGVNMVGSSAITLVRIN